MPAEEVVAIVDVLESAGIVVWLDGGWGVDALLGLDDVLALEAVLGRRGYETAGGGARP
jgi:hypothetical protein